MISSLTIRIYAMWGKAEVYKKKMKQKPRRPWYPKRDADRRLSAPQVLLEARLC